MTYDLATLERTAYQRGDMQLADLAASYMDADAENAVLADTISKLDERVAGLASGLSDMRDRMRDALDAIGHELDAAKRCGNRSAIRDAIIAAQVLREG